jgi:endogenous inhibitor of DNA gyrase (YacG/DUF329 family)
VSPAQANRPSSVAVEQAEEVVVVALVDCPECGREVSTLAVACPHCGFPVAALPDAVGTSTRPRGPSRWMDPGFWVILVGVAVVIFLSILILVEGAR